MKNILNPESKSNHIFMFIGNLTTILSALVGLVSWILKIIFIRIDGLNRDVITLLIYISHFCVVLLIICIVLIIIRLFITTIRANIKARHMHRKLMYFIHENLLHRIRNDIIQLDMLKSKVDQYRKVGNVDAIKELYDAELRKLCDNLEAYINPLATYLSEYRNNMISVCIKAFKRRDKERRDFLSEQIISLARSENTKKDRDNYGETYIGQNTDFSNLCTGQNVFFGSSNLDKLAESGSYVNDSINWDSAKNTGKYVSTLVTPIRYYNNDSKNNVKTDIIGFLCIDSREEIVEWERNDSFELQLLACFSDILYVYIKDFYGCFDDVDISVE